MSTKIAPRGEKGFPALQKVLIRIVEAAEMANGFISRKLDPWRPDQRLILAEELWNGREPYFAELMKSFHCAMKDVWALADKNREAWYFVYRVPPITRRNSDIRYVRHALETTSRVANGWLVDHPIKKVPLLERMVIRLTSKRPGVVLATIIIAVGYIHFWWCGYAKKERERKKVENDN